MRAVLLVGALVVAGCDSGRKPDAGNGAASATFGNEAIPTLVDHPERYRGKTLRLSARVNDPIFPSDGKTLRDFAGKDVRFYGFAPANGPRADVVIRMPDKADDLPAAGNDDMLIITFTCTEGSLTKGNVATAVTRP